jgi:Transcription factor IIIC subunit delta N-term
MDGPDSAFDPIILQGWPSCTDCLSWSSDGELAVATGEFVHILTPRHASKSGTKPDLRAIGLRQWHSARIRTNVFTQREWPEQYAAPSHIFSLGEEQSLSLIIGLAWSPPGIGSHRRSVLAVLTSNHVLSLWESNGTIGEWTRVFVVNQSLGDHFGRADEAGKGVCRDKRRIRKFAWSPPYRLFQAGDGRIWTSKWGSFYLAVADDAEAVTILRISKWKRRDSMEWDAEQTCHIDLPAVSANGNAPLAASLFQRAMMSKSPISSLSWSNVEESSSVSFIQVARRGRRDIIEVQASLATQEGSIDQLEQSLGLNAIHLEYTRQQNGHRDLHIKEFPEKPNLDKKIEEARNEFDSNHSLDGNARVRKWGFASRDSQDAACITIHPSDMVEYTIPSMEKCTLLFAPSASLLGSSLPLKMITANPTDVLRTITGWILSVASDVPLTLAIDRQLLGIYASYAAQFDNEEIKLQSQLAFSRLRETSESQLDPDEMEVDETVPDDSLTSSDIETCLICEALVPFDEKNLSTARCETGHPYSKSYDERLCDQC